MNAVSQLTGQSISPALAAGASAASAHPSSLRWIVAQEGSRQSYAVPVSFHRLGQLQRMYTDVWCRWGRGLLRHGPAGARSLATRFEPSLPSARVVSFNSGAILGRSLYHFRRHQYSSEDHAQEFIRFGRWFAERVRRELVRSDLAPGRDVFFGFNTNCLETLEDLKQRGVFTVVDQVDPGRVEEELIMEEVKRWPGWTTTPDRLPKAYWDRLQREWELANLVLVNSEWSAHALVQQGVPAEKIIIVPLAIDLARDHRSTPVKPQGRLKVLWLGSVILRKGIQYLVEAARRLQGEDIEFLLAGPLGIAPEVVRTFPPSIKLLGRITRDQLSAVYEQAHVFVLPTLSDGFAITQLEAMAHGLPVITTPNCGRVVTDGLDGLIVPPRDSLALAEALAAVNADRDWLCDMSRNALQKVRSYDLPSNAQLINALVMRRMVS